MYTAQNLSDNIRKRAKEKNIQIGKMLSDCGLNINTISQIKDKKGLSCFTLALIADHLDCSIDYLLGRTDNAESHKTIQQTVFTIKTAARSETSSPIQTEQMTKEELEQHIAEIESFEDIDPNL